MRRIGKVLGIIGIVLLVLALILAGVGTWFVRRPWPQTKGEIVVAGLSAPVKVVRDEWGVPNLYAQNEHDLFFAQGYVHAQDRLWQMEFNRRIASGTLSAALGEAALNTDRFLRTIGLRRAAEKDWELADDDTRAILQAYADGVNAFIESHRASAALPLEFSILGLDPEPWTPVDTLAWGAVMSFNLCSNYEFELFRAQLIAELGEEAAQQLLPPYAQGAPLIVPAEAHGYDWLRSAHLESTDALAAVLGVRGPLWGSNNWVVHGRRTASGQPLLADDMHLLLNMPSIWYENGLHGGRFDVVGYTFPGTPLIIVGHNTRIAWGVTNLAADVQDFYIEKLDDAENPSRYEFEGQWRDLQVAPETIEVKDGEALALEVLLTHHGPLMNEALGLEDAEPLALRWTALDGSRLFQAVKRINLAANWDEFRQALAYWDAPSQNFVYADVEGNIGYQMPGRVPIRAGGHQGTVPVPGWTGEYEWQGYIPFDELPRLFNPAAGFIATANNKVIGDDYPYHLAYEWGPPYRAQRITDLLAADDSVTLEDMRNIQADTYSLPAEALRPYLLAVQPESDLQARALEQAARWDLYSEADRPGAAIYHVWYHFLLQNTLGDELGEELMADYQPFKYIHAPLMIDWMARTDAVAWFDDVTTAQVETRDDVVRRSLADAVAWLSARLGDDPARWEWGRVHTMTFVHQPLGQSGIGLLESLFNSQPIPARGDHLTVDAASFAYEGDNPFAMVAGVSQRFIADLSDWGNSRSIHTTGQSGHLFHRHRQDFIEMWQDVDYHPLPFSRGAVDQNARETLTLTPP